jgi:hypothetical protein
VASSALANLDTTAMVSSVTMLTNVLQELLPVPLLTQCVSTLLEVTAVDVLVDILEMEQHALILMNVLLELATATRTLPVQTLQEVSLALATVVTVELAPQALALTLTSVLRATTTATPCMECAPTRSEASLVHANLAILGLELLVLALMSTSAHQEPATVMRMLGAPTLQVASLVLATAGFQEVEPLVHLCVGIA